MLEKHKVCIFMWDEMSIQLKLTYDTRKDIICGLKDWGSNRTGKIADHVLVFMLRGLKSGWKMPISYNFCNKQTKTAQLIRCIKDHVRLINNIDFHIVATVCDQGSSNVAAIKELLLHTDMKRNFKKRPQHETFEVDNAEIVALYDPPHLIKGIRNNLLTKDLTINCKNDKPIEIALWEEHIVENKIKKMRVKHATQVLSGTMASFIETVTKSKCSVSIDNKELKINTEEGIATTKDVHFFNDLFDSVNGCEKVIDDYNKLRRPVFDDSIHHEFWVSAKNELRKEYFKDNVSNIEVQNIDRNDERDDEPHDLITDKIVADESIVTLLLDNSQEIITLILRKVNDCSDCANSLKNSEFLVCARQIISCVNKLLKTRAHRRNVLKIVLQHLKDWNVNMNCSVNEKDTISLLWCHLPEEVMLSLEGMPSGGGGGDAIGEKM
ncbi:hypothetical protein DBV15_11737 [Temnothorax longispinosus]|uniref:Transposable element P transposase-like RNase H domain-containing protein n=1 Tax=Temnothorax longispinosus TaxID=300112 RepID=A0A4S2L1C4_9HYME|nr:hypothetical protein DBV15_11737 [Temnothorax longispinosus]